MSQHQFKFDVKVKTNKLIWRHNNGRWTQEEATRDPRGSGSQVGQGPVKMFNKKQINAMGYSLSICNKATEFKV
jgi:hypothetical protein